MASNPCLNNPLDPIGKPKPLSLVPQFNSYKLHGGDGCSKVGVTAGDVVVGSA